MRSERDENEPPGAADPNAIHANEDAEKEGRCLDEHEEQCEAEHEEAGVDQRISAIHFGLEIFEGHARDEAQVARYDGQDAGGKEGEPPSKEGQRNSEPKREGLHLRCCLPP